MGTNIKTKPHDKQRQCSVQRYETLEDLLDGEEVSSRVRGVLRAILLASAVHQQEAEERESAQAERIRSLEAAVLAWAALFVGSATINGLVFWALW